MTVTKFLNLSSEKQGAHLASRRRIRISEGRCQVFDPPIELKLLPNSELSQRGIAALYVHELDNATKSKIEPCIFVVARGPYDFDLVYGLGYLLPQLAPGECEKLPAMFMSSFSDKMEAIAK